MREYRQTRLPGGNLRSISSKIPANIKKPGDTLGRKRQTRHIIKAFMGIMNGIKR